MAELVRARTLLFVPGDRPDRFDKAAGAGADLIVLDLEDAVAADRKERARNHVAEWLTAGGRAVVRITAAGESGHGDDVSTVAGLQGLAGILLAKAESPEAVAEVAERTGVPVIPLVESAAGLVRSEAMARERATVRLAFGHLDFAVDLGAAPDRDAMLHARSTLVLASRVGGLPGPIDGVTTELDRSEAVAADVRYAYALGMTGKLVIHPSQVKATHAAMQPTQAELTWATAVIAAYEGGSVARVDGLMVDPPVLARAEAVLVRAARGAVDSTQAG
ncbi:HpcH/HpaI aldolase/citrate lyase family protein [Salinibacterium hongtaonis]|uniref:HpcH/HpaI aldolase/citrate lyase family protein n=1 Tax=Homoserinimonas hongtaonis TaxID=2079791 RepID=UPI001F544B5D|nr:CoA ester lyase [Salinibacterium hongtaonis]